MVTLFKHLGYIRIIGISLLLSAAIIACGKTGGKAPSRMKQACSIYPGLTSDACKLSLSFNTSLFVGTVGASGVVDGTGSGAKLNWAGGITSYDDFLYVTDEPANVIRRINISTGEVATIAGDPNVIGSADGVGAAAKFNTPKGIVTDGTYLYVVDSSNNTIRKIDLSNFAVTTLAGLAGSTGSTDGLGGNARFSTPVGITADSTHLYVADTANQLIRKIDKSTGAVTTLAGSAGVVGSTNSTGADARFNDPLYITTDGTNLYVAEFGGETIRKIVIATGVVTLLAGNYTTQGSNDGNGSVATFYDPAGMLYNNGFLYVADLTNHIIRRINTLNPAADNAVTTVIGQAGAPGSTEGDSITARLNGPIGMATDGKFLYVLDYSNFTIRKVN